MAAPCAYGVTAGVSKRPSSVHPNPMRLFLSVTDDRAVYPANCTGLPSEANFIFGHTHPVSGCESSVSLRWRTELSVIKVSLFRKNR